MSTRRYTAADGTPMCEDLAHHLRCVDYSGMEPRKNPRQPIFRDHNCGDCDSGARPCREGNYNNCSHPRARND